MEVDVNQTAKGNGDPEGRTGKLARDAHIRFIQDLQEESLVGVLTEHLRLNGMYWGLTALALMGAEDALDREEVVRYVMACWSEKDGGFGAHPGHDSHLLSTLSAIQILVQYDALERINVDKVVICTSQRCRALHAADSF